jgi:hypothetical protein
MHTGHEPVSVDGTRRFAKAPGMHRSSLRSPWCAAAFAVAICSCGSDDADDGAAATDDSGDDSASADDSTTDGDSATATVSASATADTSGGDDDPTATTATSDDGTTGPGIDPPTTVEDVIAIYGSAWNETDPAARLALLELVWADGGVYRDPLLLAEGREALSDAIGASQAMFPGAQIEIVGEVDSYGGLARFYWSFSGRPPLPGMDFAELDDDLRLVGITGFFGELPQDTEVPPALQAYLEAWNEPDAAMRMALLADAVTDDVHYTDPTVDAPGIDALDAAIVGFQDQFAGSTLVATSTPDAYGDQMRYGWAIEDADGNVTFSGIDVAIIAGDGRLLRVVGFFDTP